MPSLRRHLCELTQRLKRRRERAQKHQTRTNIEAASHKPSVLPEGHFPGKETAESTALWSPIFYVT